MNPTATTLVSSNRDKPESRRNPRPSGLTRRTHPRSARAHRRALCRAFREAIRRALSRGSVALLAGAMVAGASQAQERTPYVPLYTTEGGSVYVLLKSDNVVDNYLAIHFDAAHGHRQH